MIKTLFITSLLFSLLAPGIASSANAPTGAKEPHELYGEAMAYLLGRHGKTKSTEVAFKKFEKLAFQGWKTAQHMLGNMYSKGEGTNRNLVQAYIWYSLAANQDFSIAINKVQGIKVQLEEAEIQEAELLIKEWKGKTMNL